MALSLFWQAILSVSKQQTDKYWDDTIKDINTQRQRDTIWNRTEVQVHLLRSLSLSVNQLVNKNKQWSKEIPMNGIRRASRNKNLHYSALRIKGETTYQLSLENGCQTFASASQNDDWKKSIRYLLSIRLYIYCSFAYFRTAAVC